MGWKPFVVRETRLATTLDALKDIVQRAQQDLREIVEGLKNLVTNDKLVTVTFDALVEKKVYHGLGFSPRTWEVVGIKAPVGYWVYETPTVNDHRDQYLLMIAEPVVGLDPVTVTLRFS